MQTLHRSATHFLKRDRSVFFKLKRHQSHVDQNVFETNTKPWDFSTYPLPKDTFESMRFPFHWRWWYVMLVPWRVYKHIQKSPSNLKHSNVWTINHPQITINFLLEFSGTIGQHHPCSCWFGNQSRGSYDKWSGDVFLSIFDISSISIPRVQWAQKQLLFQDISHDQVVVEPNCWNICCSQIRSFSQGKRGENSENTEVSPPTQEWSSIDYRDSHLFKPLNYDEWRNS